MDEETSRKMYKDGDKSDSDYAIGRDNNVIENNAKNTTTEAAQDEILLLLVDDKYLTRYHVQRYSNHFK